MNLSSGGYITWRFEKIQVWITRDTGYYIPEILRGKSVHDKTFYQGVKRSLSIVFF